MQIRGGANVTICDCKGGGYVKNLIVGVVPYQATSLDTKSYLTVNSGSFGTVNCTPSAEMVINDGTFDRVSNYGKTVINGGVFSTSATYYAAVTNGQYYNQANPPHNRAWFGDLTINGGSFTGKTAGLSTGDGANAVVNGGTFTGENCGIDLDWYGETNIVGGTITGTSGPGIKFSDGSTNSSSNLVISGGSVTGAAGHYAIDAVADGSVHLKGNVVLDGGKGDILLHAGSSDEYSSVLYLDGPIEMTELQVGVTVGNNGDSSDIVRIPDSSTATVDDLRKITNSDPDAVIVVDETNKTLGIIYPKFIEDQPDAEDPTVGADDIPGYTTYYKWLYSASETEAGDPVGDTSADLDTDKVTKTGWYWCEVTWSNGVDTPYVRETEKVYYHIHNLCNNDSCAEHITKLSYKVVNNLSELEAALAAGGDYVLTSGSYSSDTVEDIEVNENVNLCLGDVSSLDLGKARLVVAEGKTLNITTCAPMSGEVKFINTTTCDAPVEIKGTLGLYGVGLVINAKSDYGVENYGTLHVDCGGIEVSTAKTAVYHGGAALLFAGGSDVIAPTTDVYLATGKVVSLKGSADALAASLVIDTAAAPSHGTGRVAVVNSDTDLADADLDLFDGGGMYYAEFESSADKRNVVFGAHGGWINGFCRHGELQPCETDADGNYVITNAGQLYWFAERVNEHGELYANAVVANDIIVPEEIVFGSDTFDVPDWTPIGTEAKAFNGDFDGGEHSIKGISFDNANATYAGLFGAIDWSGTVKDLTVTDSSFRGAYYVGAIAGYSEGEIINCHNDGTSVYAAGGFDFFLSLGSTGIPFGNSSFVGGICGSSSNTVELCSNSGSVTGACNLVGGISGFSINNHENCTNSGDVNGAAFVGGIVGAGIGNNIDNSNSGDVKADGSIVIDLGGGFDFGDCSLAGGIAGAAFTPIEGAENSGTVESEHNMVGGITGAAMNLFNYSDFSIVGTNSGAVTGGALVGGIAGGAMGDIVDSSNSGTITAEGDNTVLDDALIAEFGTTIDLHFAGGISGWHVDGSIKRSFNTGAVYGQAAVGGIAGAFNGYLIDNCYNQGALNVPKADANASVPEFAVAGGIAGAQGSADSIQNCYSAPADANMSGLYDVKPIVDADGMMFTETSTVNTYYLAAAEGTDGARDAAQFASGEVTLLLNSSNADPVWGQKIGLDPYPIFGTIQLPIADAVIELSDEEFVYDGTEKSVEVLSVTLRTRAAVPESAYIVSGNKGTDAGTYVVEVTANEGSDYYGTATAEFRILPKTITADIVVANKTYDGTDGARITSAELVGIVSGDDVALVLGSAKFSDALPGVGKSVSFSGFSLSGADAGNYELQPLSATADITPVPAAARPNPSTGVHF